MAPTHAGQMVADRAGPYRGWRWSLPVILLLLVLPVGIVHRVIGTGIDERLDTEIAARSLALAAQARAYRQSFQLERVIGPLARWLLARPPSRHAARQLRRWTGPGCAWLPYRSDGTPCRWPSPVPTATDSFWPRIVQRFVIPRQRGLLPVHFGFRQAGRLDPAMAAFQSWMGPGIRAELLINHPDRFWPSVTPQHSVWAGVFEAAAASATDVNPISGVVVVLEDAAVRAGLAIRLAFRGWTDRPLGTDTLAIGLDARSGRVQAWHGPFPPSPTGRPRLPRPVLAHRAAVLREPAGTVIRAGEHLLARVGLDYRTTVQPILLADLSALFTHHRWARRAVDRLVIAWLLLLGAAALAGRAGLFGAWPLARRFAVMIALAVLLPTAVLLHVHDRGRTGREDDTARRQRQRLQEVAQVVHQRLGEAHLHHGAALTIELRELARDPRPREAWRAALDGWIDRGWIDRYYLADADGSFLHEGCGAGPPNSLLFRHLLQNLLRSLASERTEADPKQSLPASIVEEYSRPDPRSGQVWLRDAPPGQFKRIRTGAFDRWLAWTWVPTGTPSGQAGEAPEPPESDRPDRPLRRRQADRPLLLLYEVGTGNMVVNHLRRELARGRYADPAAHPVPVEVFAQVGDIRLPDPTAAIFADPVVAAASSRPTEAFGVTTLEDDRLLFYLPAVSSAIGNSRLLLITRPTDDPWSPLTRLAVGAVTLLLLIPQFAHFIAGRLLTPLGRLDDALHRICDGDLDWSLPIESTDELGQLAAAFNQMAQAWRERERLCPYLSDSLTAAVGMPPTDLSDATAGAPCDRLAAPRTAAAPRETFATVLLADIRDFTAHCERHPPATIFRALNGYLAGAERVIRNRGGRIEKFIGDALVAVFLPRAEPISADEPRSPDGPADPGAHDGRQCPVAARTAARNASFARCNGADRAGDAAPGATTVHPGGSRCQGASAVAGQEPRSRDRGGNRGAESLRTSMAGAWPPGEQLPGARQDGAPQAPATRRETPVLRSATGPSAAAAAAAVLAALDLQEFVAIHNRWTRARGLPDFAIGVGIDSGPLVLGEIGAEHRRELALIGEVVPLAARMESASKLGQHRRIAISQRTRQLLGDRVATAPLTGMRCRGATAPMTSFEVIDWCGPRPTPA